MWPRCVYMPLDAPILTNEITILGGVWVCVQELGGIHGTLQLRILNHMEEELHLRPKKLPGLHFQGKSPLSLILRALPILTLLQAKETETHATM